MNRWISCLLLILIAGPAFAEGLPMGSFSLEKGALGCPVELQLEDKPACLGMVMRNTSSKTETDLCNINGGKYLRRWSEEGIAFKTESKTIQNSNLLQMHGITVARQAHKVLRRSETSVALFFRGGRLELENEQDGKAVSCLYSRQSPALLPASASAN